MDRYLRCSRRLLVVGAVLALTAACGTPSSTTAGTAPAPVQAAIDSGAASPLGSTVLAQTIGEAAEADSASFEGSVQLLDRTAGEAQDEAAEPLSLAFSGSYDLSAPASQVVLDLSGLAGLGTMTGSGLDLPALLSDPMEIIAVDDQIYVRGGVASLIDADSWIQLDAGSASPVGDQLGAYGGRGPIEVLEALEDLEATIEDLGRETVRGVATQHVRATVDLAGLDGAGGGAAGHQLDGGELPIDLWIGDDGRIYRFRFDVDAGDVPAVAGPLAGGTATFSVELFDYGVDPGITAPAEADTIRFGSVPGWEVER